MAISLLTTRLFSETLCAISLLLTRLPPTRFPLFVFKQNNTKHPFLVFHSLVLFVRVIVRASYVLSNPCYSFFFFFKGGNLKLLLLGAGEVSYTLIFITPSSLFLSRGRSCYCSHLPLIMYPENPYTLPVGKINLFQTDEGPLPAPSWLLQPPLIRGSERAKGKNRTRKRRRRHRTHDANGLYGERDRTSQNIDHKQCR